MNKTIYIVQRLTLQRVLLSGLVSFIICTKVYTQFLDAEDFNFRVWEPKNVEVNLFNQVNLSADSYGNISVNAEVINFRTFYKNGISFSINAYASHTLYNGHDIILLDHLNSLAKVIDPVGGEANVSGWFTYPLLMGQSTLIKLGTRIGTRWIVTNKSGNDTFSAQQVNLGVSIQHRIKESFLNQGVYIVIYPHYFYNFVKEENTLKHFYPEPKFEYVRYKAPSDPKVKINYGYLNSPPISFEVFDVQGYAIQCSLIVGSHFKAHFSFNGLLGIPDLLLDITDGYKYPGSDEFTEQKLGLSGKTTVLRVGFSLGF